METLKILLILVLIIPGYAANDLLLGLEPAMTVEPFYEDNEFDLNLVPLVIHQRGAESLKTRLILQANYHFADEAGFNNVGLEVARPAYIFEEGSFAGAYTTPIVSLGLNILDDQLKSTMGGEIGYSFDTETNWRFNVALQVGATFFGENDTGPSEWKNHFGIKFHFGKWIF